MTQYIKQDCILHPMESPSSTPSIDCILLKIYIAADAAMLFFLI